MVQSIKEYSARISNIKKVSNQAEKNEKKLVLGPKGSC